MLAPRVADHPYRVISRHHSASDTEKRGDPTASPVHDWPHLPAGLIDMAHQHKARWTPAAGIRIAMGTGTWSGTKKGFPRQSDRRSNTGTGTSPSNTADARTTR